MDPARQWLVRRATGLPLGPAPACLPAWTPPASGWAVDVDVDRSRILLVWLGRAWCNSRRDSLYCKEYSIGDVWSGVFAPAQRFSPLPDQQAPFRCMGIIPSQTALSLIFTSAEDFLARNALF
jgi:hypothetical protein